MSVLVLAPEPLRASPTGPSRRAIKLAEAIATRCEVTLAAPAPSTFPEGPFRTVSTGPPDDQDLAREFARHDAVVVQTLPSPRQLLVALRHARRLVVDLIAPFALEAREMGDDAAVRWRAREMVAHLTAADLVVCSNERQRDLALGAGLAAGLLTRAAPAPPLDERLVVVPHGLDRLAVGRGRSALRTGELSDEGLRIAIWGGGIWGWLDALTAVRAAERLRSSRPDVRLAFVGLEHPDPVQRAAHAEAVAAARAEVARRGLDDTVVFRPRWLSREEYLEHLADADVGVSLHEETLEARFASRTRLVDYLEAGLPVVATSGDAMSAYVERYGLGRVVAPGDDAAVAAAIDALTSGDATRVAEGALEALRWERVAQPLVEFCASPPAPRRRSRAAAIALVAAEYPAFLRAVHREPGGGVARTVGRRAARLVSGRLRRA